MGDEIEELNEQLAKEEERADAIVLDLDQQNAIINELEVDVEALTDELRIKTRELDQAQVGGILLLPLRDSQLTGNLGRSLSHERILQRLCQGSPRKVGSHTRTVQS
jgi:hypothetical protein